MNLIDLLRSLARRWPVTLAGVLLAAAATTMVYRSTPVTYQLESSVVLLPPEVTVGDDENPYMLLGGLDQALDVLVRAMNAEAIQDEIDAEEPNADYTVQRDATTSGPILVIEVTAPTPGQAASVMDALRGRVPVELEGLQEGLAVAPTSRITSREIAVDTTATEDARDRTRLTIATAGASLVVIIALVAITDRLVERRRRRRSAVPGDADDDSGAPDDGGDHDDPAPLAQSSVDDPDAGPPDAEAPRAAALSHSDDR